MLYLNESGVKNLNVHWGEIMDVIERSVVLLSQNDFSQPVKPYLRYKDPKNRIIAMPAFIGGDINVAGIKWIASFPGNIKKNVPRAHSVIILNEAETGKPIGILNTALVSGMRTAGVSALMLKHYLLQSPVNEKKLTLGIIGFGPIGQLHADMVANLFADRVERILVFDINGKYNEEVISSSRIPIEKASSWESLFDQSDIVITCTVSDSRYINRAPRPGSLHLNVSLRDYDPSFIRYVDTVIVDDWEEVCRENTDIELMHKTQGLTQDKAYTIKDVVCNGLLANGKGEDVIMFNPMGMAVFDMAVGKYIFERAKKKNAGVLLEG